jgi:DNA-binding response OmpR family regulator
MARLLLVDDDRDLLDALSDWLTLQGHRVRAAGEAEAALDACPDFDPDLVLLDGVLPGLPGPELAAELESRGVRRIVFLSGLERDALPASATVLSKPVDLEALERTIRRLLR